MSQSKTCVQCGNVFFKKSCISQKEWDEVSKFCSRKCMGIYRSENPVHHSRQFKKGFTPWNKGKKSTIPENEHYAWKGDDISYSGIHHWVKKHLGSPTKCKHCGKDDLIGHQIQWANKSGKYLRDITDWIRLCISCHIEYDKSNTSH